jgi:hypothetical protein
VSQSNRQVLALGGLIGVATLALHIYPICRPMIVFDDFAMLVRSLTWTAAWQNVWTPANEHAMPLGRLSTAALVNVAGRQTNFPLAFAMQGPIALFAGMGLFYAFVRREMGHPWYGLVAIALFGVTSIYQQAVNWYSASFSLLTLDTLLVGLLAAQEWSRTRRLGYLLWCIAASGIALGWFASGIFVGPLCCLYLLSGGNHEVGVRNVSSNNGKSAKTKDKRSWLAWLSPLLGTAAFLVVSLPRTAPQILHTEHYQGETALQSFHPFVGLINTAGRW